MGKMTVRIFDSAFTPFSKSASLREENVDIEPTYFKWVDGNEHPNDGKPVFYTDNEIWRRDSFEPNAVAWLLEPRCLRPENYEAAQAKAHLFKAVLSYDQKFLEAIHNGRFYPFGGSSIAPLDWGIHPKDRNKRVCMFVSDKESTEGHRLRKEILDSNLPIDFYGGGAGNYVKRKVDVLSDYLFCVVVESCRIDSYFSEKITDAIIQGCLIYYWGCPSIGRYFEMGSIRVFDNVTQLRFLLERDHVSQYLKALPFIMENFILVQDNIICEDFIYQNHGDLFE